MVRCPSVSPVYQPLHAAAVGLLLRSGRPGERDGQRQLPGITTAHHTAARRTAADAGGVTLSAQHRLVIN